MWMRAVLFGLALAAPAAGLELGATAPKADVKMKNVDGRELTITEIAGKQGTLVIFTCNHCPWAKAWEERIAALGNEYAKRGIGVIAVNANDPKTNTADGFDGMVERSKQRGFQFAYVVDSGSTVAKAFGAERTPEVFLFDAGGKLVYHGTVDDNAENASAVKQHYLRDALESVATGKPVAVAETKALGCTIKYY
ncbi:MAG: thioredoxin family protein [Deltaproteobacteria bacterium]|nr:thioredoxin family protein [Deltaproteobacteria bacterium]